MLNSIRIAIAVCAILVVQTVALGAAEIRVLSALGMKEVLEDLAPKFERASGHKLTISFGTMGGIVKRVQDGETADVIIIPKQGIDDLVKAGKAASADATVVASSGISVAIRKGAPKPDISSPDALKRTLVAAKSITYSNPADGGASAIHFVKVLDRLGIADEIKAKTIYAKPGNDAAVLVSEGKAELGVNQLQVLITVAGVDIAGPLPGDLQATTVFSASILPGTRNGDAGNALIRFLRTPEATAVIKSKGMEPGS